MVVVLYYQGLATIRLVGEYFSYTVNYNLIKHMLLYTALETRLWQRFAFLLPTVDPLCVRLLHPDFSLGKGYA